MKIKKNLKKIILILVASVSIFAIILFFCSFMVIYQDVKDNCLEVQKEYGDDCVSSLIKLVQSENHTARSKNSAIWSLGQLADKKALPFLYELDKSLLPQEKCDLDKYLCKYEVQKAIKWFQKGNITSWMYGNRESWH